MRSNSFGPNTLQFRLGKLLWGKTLFFFIFSMRVCCGELCKQLITRELV